MNTSTDLHWCFIMIVIITRLGHIYMGISNTAINQACAFQRQCVHYVPVICYNEIWYEWRLYIYGSKNGAIITFHDDLSPAECQALIYISMVLLLLLGWETKVSDMRTKIQKYVSEYKCKIAFILFGLNAFTKCGLTLIGCKMTFYI